MLRIAVVGALLAALAVPALASSGSAQRTTVGKCGTPTRVKISVRKRATVGDYFISPSPLRVRPGACVTWRWSGANFDSHDVALRSAPRRVRKFRSKIASTDYSYSRWLVRRGTYRVYCSLHPQMQQRIVVK